MRQQLFLLVSILATTNVESKIKNQGLRDNGIKRFMVEPRERTLDRPTPSWNRDVSEIPEDEKEHFMCFDSGRIVPTRLLCNGPSMQWDCEGGEDESLRAGCNPDPKPMPCQSQSTISTCDKLIRCPRRKNIHYCPKVERSSDVKITCNRRVLTVLNVTKCLCVKCPNQNLKKIVSGRVTKSSDNSLLKYGSIYHGENRIGFTNSRGLYRIKLDANEDKATLVFKGRGVMATTKVVNLEIDELEIAMNVTMLVAEKTIKFNANKAIAVEVGKNAQNVMAKMSIPPNSVVDQNGNLISGEVRISLATMQTTNPNDIEKVPGTFTSTEGPLLSGGMFTLDIDCGVGKTCSLNNVDIVANTNLRNMELWVLNDNGIWEKVRHTRRGKRETINFQGVKIDANRLYNLDQVWAQYCYVKVRIYDSNSDLAEKGTIRALYQDAGDNWIGFMENYLTSLNYDRQGTCMQVPCDEENPIKKTIFTARLNGHPLKVQITPPSTVGYSYFATNWETASVNIDPIGPIALTKTPFFELTLQSGFNRDDLPRPYYTNRQDCFTATLGDPHFSFYSDQPPTIPNLNYISFDESVFEVGHPLQQDPLFWYPNEDVAKICFMKVAIANGQSNQYLVSSTNYGGVLPNIRGKYIGTRFVNLKNSDGYIDCIEYKCTDSISSLNGAIDYPNVVLRVEEAICTLQSINTALETYLNIQSNTVSNSIGARTFEMYSPQEPELTRGTTRRTVDFGNGVIDAKENAYNNCKNSAAVAVTFRCRTLNG